MDSRMIVLVTGHAAMLLTQKCASGGRPGKVQTEGRSARGGSGQRVLLRGMTRFRGRRLWCIGHEFGV